MINRRTLLQGILSLPFTVLIPKLKPNYNWGMSSGKRKISNVGLYSVHIQKINVSANLGREQIMELGRRGPYFKPEIH